MNEPCPICGVVDCKGFVYSYMVSEYAAGRNRGHWRRIHDREGGAGYPPASGPTREDVALRTYLARHGCCGGGGDGG